MTQETRLDLRFPSFVGLVAVAATAQTAIAIDQNVVVLRPGLYPALIALAVALLASESLSVFMPNGPSVSLSYPLSVAAIVYFGPAIAAGLCALSLMPSIVSAPRSRRFLTFANLAQLVLCTVSAGFVYTALGGWPLASGAGRITGATGLLAMAAAAAAGVVLNGLVLAVGFSVLQNRPVLGVIRELLGTWMLSSQIMLGFVGVAIAEVLLAVGAPGLALFVVPLLVARQTYQQSVRLKSAYADTMSSLVAALEAKDVYTKGHSVRVAEYTVMIASKMGLEPTRIERIERAALLHDLGKVGVSRRVLSKEGRLTDEEYAEIKRHPEIGAHIVAGVSYLADLVPAIEHHHERLDGRGYGSGASGEEIPLEARILAVADSYDAMTSARPYRGAMSHEDAVGELRANCGTQFDPEAVDAFVRAYEVAKETRNVDASE